jgi:hypothetical protein
MSIASHSDSDMFLIQIVVMVKGWSVSGPLLILLKTQKPLPGYAVSDSKRIPQAALLQWKDVGDESFWFMLLHTA